MKLARYNQTSAAVAATEPFKNSNNYYQRHTIFQNSIKELISPNNSLVQLAPAKHGRPSYHNHSTTISQLQ